MRHIASATPGTHSLGDRAPRRPHQATRVCWPPATKAPARSRSGCGTPWVGRDGGGGGQLHLRGCERRFHQERGDEGPPHEPEPQRLPASAPLTLLSRAAFCSGSVLTVRGCYWTRLGCRGSITRVARHLGMMTKTSGSYALTPPGVDAARPPITLPSIVPASSMSKLPLAYAFNGCLFVKRRLVKTLKRSTIAF